MSKAEALIYMCGILEERWFLTQDDEVGRLNGDVFPGGRKGREILHTKDPAAWSDWEQAVKKITNEVMITEIQAKLAMIELMKEYNKQGFHLQETIDHFQHVLIQPNERWLD
ncbi:MAG TPA: hypothetical protein VMB24_02520 [Dehalococcoidales bacterium]|nr:hypothetical protein [Dehalococcoidales bacterium]